MGLLKKRDLTPEETLRLLKGIAAGMAHLHSEGLVHRDIASRNILLHQESGQLKAVISDFGFTRQVNKDTEMAVTGTDMGPVRWMVTEARISLTHQAPESLGSREYSFKSDTYSFGVLGSRRFDCSHRVVYEMITRKLPWEELDQVNTIIAVLDKKKLNMPSTCPPQLRKLADWCWEYDPRNRPTAQQIFDILEELTP